MRTKFNNNQTKTVQICLPVLTTGRATTWLLCQLCCFEVKAAKKKVCFLYWFNETFNSIQAASFFHQFFGLLPSQKKGIWQREVIQVAKSMAARLCDFWICLERPIRAQHISIYFLSDCFSTSLRCAHLNQPEDTNADCHIHKNPWHKLLWCLYIQKYVYIFEYICTWW